ncbi:MmgE/PrpD family protein [Viridothelium virens]|uniref:MmgE/PrpD family protein n=1 Tax=Viridothelium virens TaxID=1048519 RepID=A0A6A6HF92_VIRVR|nr:MmgE/PrpD family protein [Viridothelium virens]
MATAKLAQWAVNLQFSQLPSSVTQAANRSFYNWAGCAIGGSTHPATLKASTALRPFFGQPTSSLLGRSASSQDGKADAQHAALINGIASHVHDYDDTHLETIIHPTGPVASALLAQAEALETPTSGKDFLLALVAGIEAECKLGLTVWPKHYDLGWHITSTVGSIGAAVAVGKLLKLDEEKMGHAISIAATQVTGLREQFGSDTKSFHIGRSAQNGLLAAALARNGYTGSLHALEAKRGWVNVVGAGSNRLEEMVGSLGTIWEVEKNSFKPFPCGIVVHPSIDGCIQLHDEMRERGLVANEDTIESVKARVHPLVLELTGKKTPIDGLQAKFSVYHGAAVGLVMGKAGPAQYEDPLVISQEIVGVRERFEATADGNLMADEADILLTMKDGTVLRKHVEHAIGSLEAPMTDEQLQTKFKDQSMPVLGRNGTAAASKAFRSMEGAESVAKIAPSI